MRWLLTVTVAGCALGACGGHQRFDAEKAAQMLQLEGVDERTAEALAQQSAESCELGEDAYNLLIAMLIERANTPALLAQEYGECPKFDAAVEALTD